MRFLAADDPDITESDRRRLVAAAAALDSEPGPANPLAGEPSQTLNKVAEAYIEHVLAWTDTQAEAAQVLGVDPSTLRRRQNRGQ